MIKFNRKLFTGWLENQNPDGFSLTRQPRLCPVAKCLLAQGAEVESVAPDYLIYNAVRIPTPAFAAEFIRAVDLANPCRITNRRALEILREI